MPKLKTNKSVRKRFKVTRNGKVLAPKSKRRHMMADRSQKMKRQSRGWHLVDKSDAHRVKKSLPYG